MKKKKVIIDADPGVDDAIALGLALMHPDLDVIGVTTTYGNASEELCTRNARLILEALNKTGVPIASGAREPINGMYLGPVPQVHGHDGLGNAACFPKNPLSSKVRSHAVQFIWETICDSPGEISIIALGPLTNLAMLLGVYPLAEGLVREIVIMGGNALSPGNATPCAEANFHNDPEAADRVLGAKWPVAMVGLDVTHKVPLRRGDLESIRTMPTAFGELMAKALPHYVSFFERTNGIEGVYSHDPTAVAYVIAPDLFVMRKWPVRVESQGISRGKSWPALGDTDTPSPEAWASRPLVSVAVDVDALAVRNVIVSTLTSPT